MDWPRLCTTRLTDQNFGMCITPQDLIMPFYNLGTNYFRPWKISDSATKDSGSAIDVFKDKFQISLDVQHFKPNEISVKVTDKEIIIEAKHEDRQDDHGFISRRFIRRYALPSNCLSETVTSTLSSDGILIVVADMKLAKITKENEKVVPIKMSGPCPKKAELKFTEPKNSQTEIKKDVVLDKKQNQLMLKEDHCRLMKPELLKEAVSDTERILSESRKETDELLKLISLDKGVRDTTSDKLEEAFGNCKTAMAELKEKVEETSVAASSEISSLKCRMMETFESQESLTSITKSSMSSNRRAASEKSSELVSDVISAELKDAAEII